MNHPGIILSVLLAVLLAALPAVVRWKNSTDAISEYGYVCPPCACSGHALTYKLPGTCDRCAMPLIPKDHVRLNVIDRFFRTEHRFDIYHHKLFYPAYFLALFLGVLSLWRYRHRASMLWFLLFYLTYVSYAFKSHLSGTGHSMHASPRWFYFPGSFLLLAGPAFYFYVRQYVGKTAFRWRAHWLHLLPVALVVVIHTVLFFGPVNWRLAGQYNSYDHYPGLAEQLTFFCSTTFYGICSWRCFRQQQPTEQGARYWLFSLLIWQGVLLLIWSLLLFANFYFYNWMATGMDYHLIWLLVAALGLAGAYGIIFYPDQLSPQLQVRESRISQELLPELCQKLKLVMETQRPYLNPDLHLQQLADLLDIREKELSELLNTGLNTSFYNFINQYRIEAVKAMLLDPQKQHLTNFAIAQEAGFSSRSTFFNLFKKYEGMTPGAFKKSAGLSSKHV